MRTALGFFVSAVALVVLAALPSAPQQIPSPRDVVSPKTFVSMDPVGRSSQFQIAVVAKIRQGFHINAREKSAEYLIATDLRADVPAGLHAGEVSYPKGGLQTFSFSKTPLNVYQGTVTLKMPVSVLPSAAIGAQHIPLKLRYQACSTEVCLPPVTLTLEATVNVADAATASKPAHPEVFRQK